LEKKSCGAKMPEGKQQNEQPPVYTGDILTPPQFTGVPGQLIPWSSNGQPVVGPNYAVFGTDTQVLQVVLQPGGLLTAEPGTLMYMAPQVKVLY
jgi:hypothetical protein